MNEIPAAQLLSCKTKHGVLLVTGDAVLRLCRHDNFGHVIAKCYQTCERTTKMFEEETRVLKHIEHKNILKVYGTTSWTEGNAVILEFPECGSLHILQHETNVKLTLDFKVHLLYQVICAIHYLHCEMMPPYTHGLIYPENILLNKNLDVKLAGFEGCQGKFIPLYSAPELQDGSSKPNPAMDMYSLSMVLYELLTDETVYYDINLPLKFLQILVCCGIKRPNVDKIEELLTSQKMTRKNLEFYEQALSIVTTCWDKMPENRMTITEVKSHIQPYVSKPGDISSVVEQLNTLNKLDWQGKNEEVGLNAFTKSFQATEDQADAPGTIDKNQFSLLNRDNAGTSKSSKFVEHLVKIPLCTENAVQWEDTHIQSISGVYEFINETSAIVGPEGAVLFVGGCTVDIPPGALSTSTEVTINSYYGSKDKTIEIVPLLKCRPGGLLFHKAITITLGSSYIAENDSPTNCLIETSKNGLLWRQYQPAALDKRGCITFKARHFCWWKVFVKKYRDIYYGRKRKTLQFLKKNDNCFECVFTDNLLSYKDAQNFPSSLHVDILEMGYSQNIMTLQLSSPNVVFQPSSRTIENAFYEVKDNTYFDIESSSLFVDETCEITYTITSNDKTLRKKSFRVDWSLFNVPEKLVNATQAIPNDSFYQFARRVLHSDDACIDDAQTNFSQNFSKQKRHILVAWKKTHGRNKSFDDLTSMALEFRSQLEKDWISAKTPQTEMMDRHEDVAVAGPSKVVNANSATASGAFLGQDSITMSNSPIYNNCQVTNYYGHPRLIERSRPRRLTE